MDIFLKLCEIEVKLSEFRIELKRFNEPYCLVLQQKIKAKTLRPHEVEAIAAIRKDLKKIVEEWKRIQPYLEGE